MKIDISFHKVDHSDALENFIRSKSESLGPFLGEADHLKWVVGHSGKQFEPHLDMVLAGSEPKLVKSVESDPFKAVAEVIQKSKRLLRDRHGRRSKLH